MTFICSGMKKYVVTVQESVFCSFSFLLPSIRFPRILSLHGDAETWLWREIVSGISLDFLFCFVLFCISCVSVCVLLKTCDLWVIFIAGIKNFVYSRTGIWLMLSYMKMNGKSSFIFVVNTLNTAV